MFDNIGRDLDEGIRRRSAQSAALAVTAVGAAAALSAILGFTAAETLLGDTEPGEPLLQLVLWDPGYARAPPPPPAAGVPQPTATPRPPAEPRTTPSTTPPTGQADGNGLSDGGPEGAASGTPGGSGDAPPNAGGPAAVHWSELEVRRRVEPAYPRVARGLALKDQHCLATVRINKAGVPINVAVERCPSVFHAETKRALMKWRWVPLRTKRANVTVRTTIAITYKLR